MGRYDGKTAVITGGTSGMGLATAKHLVSHGARVLVTGRSPDTLESARIELGDNAIVLASDAAALADIDTLAAAVKDSFGELNLLFVNAGVGPFVPFAEVYDEVFGINAKGPFFTVQKLAPLMPDGSAVVLTTSIANVKGMPMISVYAAPKAALRSMARTLAVELQPRGIRVNAVTPGPITTPIMHKSGLPDEAVEQFHEQLREGTVMKRWGDPEEIARAVAFLAFDATFTTGAELPVDGGLSQV